MTFLFLFLGLVVGTIGTLIGAGGGFILMPILLLMYPEESPQKLIAISLAVVFLNATSGSLAYALKRRIDYRSMVIFSLASIPGTLLGTYAIGFFPRDKFQIFFGVLMGLMSVYLLFPKKPKLDSVAAANSRHPIRRLIDSTGNVHLISYNLNFGIGVSLVVGFFSSLLGIGGGIIHVPAMIKMLNFPVHIATATSLSILSFMAAIATTDHFLAGNLENSWQRIFLLAPGVIVGAQFGAYLSQRMKAAWIVNSLAIALLIVAIRIVFF